MNFLDDALSFTDARGALLKAVKPITVTERVPLGEASGRILAQDVAARRDLPPFDRAQRDGYAVQAADTAAATRTDPVKLRLRGHVYAGHEQHDYSDGVHRLNSGDCIHIATGAPVPRGADAVVELEQTEHSGSTVTLFAPVAGGHYIAPRGSDVVKGTHLIAQGTRISPEIVHTLASFGMTAVSVYRRPRVAIIPTGTELADVGTPLRQGEIYNSNAYFLAELVKAHGGNPWQMPIARDTPASMEAALKKAAPADIIVLSGSSSLGERDLAERILRQQGTLLFHGVAMRPGRSSLAGTIKNAVVVGVPGNPSACILCAHLFLRPALRACARLPDTVASMPARLADTIDNKRKQYTVLFVKVDGESVVPLRGSMMESIAQADGFVEIPADVSTLRKNARVTVTLL